MNHFYSFLIERWTVELPSKHFPFYCKTCLLIPLLQKSKTGTQQSVVNAQLLKMFKAENDRLINR